MSVKDEDQENYTNSGHDEDSQPQIDSDFDSNDEGGPREKHSKKGDDDDDENIDKDDISDLEEVDGNI